MAKAKRLILHAGLPKTATTSIQGAIFENRIALFHECGTLYPGNEANHTNALCTAFLKDPRSHISNKISGKNNLDELKDIGRGILEKFVDEIVEKQPEVILFSAEGMSNLEERELADFRDWALELAETTDVLYFVRHPVRYCTSVVQQHLKGGEVLGDMYDSPPLANFKGRIGNALRVWGRESVTIRTFEEMVEYPDGVGVYFLTSVGLDAGSVTDRLKNARVFENKSLSHEAAMILSSLNRQRPAFVDGKRASKRTLDELLLIQNIRGRKFTLPAELQQKVARLSVPDVQWLRDLTGMNLYENILDESYLDPTPSISEETVDSIAILLSNLMNFRKASALMNRARSLQNSGDEVELQQLAQEIVRISPEQKLPMFLSRLLPDWPADTLIE